MSKKMIKVAYETAKSIHKVGAISDAEMLEFETLCFPKIKKLKPKDIKRIRLRFIPIADGFSHLQCCRLCSNLDVLTKKKRRNISIFQSFFEGRTSKDEYKM